MAKIQASKQAINQSICFKIVGPFLHVSIYMDGL